MIGVDLPSVSCATRATDRCCPSGKDGLEELVRLPEVIVPTVRGRVGNRLYRTFEFTSSAVGAFIGLNPHPAISLINTVDRTNIDACLILVSDTSRAHVK